MACAAICGENAVNRYFTQGRWPVLAGCVGMCFARYKVTREKTMVYKEICRLVAHYNISKLQNHPANITQDHLTICAYFARETQFAAHADSLQKKADAFDAQESGN